MREKGIVEIDEPDGDQRGERAAEDIEAPCVQQDEEESARI